MKNYQEVLDYLYARLPMFHRIGDSAYKKDLTNTFSLCASLGNPHQHYPVVHVAGTNGKGSTSHLIASMLQEMGYKVGLYTSPHYVDFRERIKINGTLVTEKYITDFVNEYEELLDQVQPSFFEATVAMAFDYFSKEKVDIAVIEVGLGGRLDSTNIVTPLVSVITNIGFDHMQFLGNTLPEIASEKAGIIKQNVPVVIGETADATREVFIQVAKNNDATIVFADQQIQIKKISAQKLSNKLHINVLSLQKSFEVDCPLLADYQLPNIATAIQTMIVLADRLPKKNNLEEIVAAGIRNIYTNTYFIGRWMVMQESPAIIYDSAHNEHGLRQVFDQVNALSYHKLHIVFGTVADKDIELIKSLLPERASYYFVAADIPRAMPAAILQQKMIDAGFNGKAYVSVLEGYHAALAEAEKNDLILVLGSIFVVGELMAKTAVLPR
jgi:dihydrofolate synthase/folylpolyglutamate synthase